MLEKKEWELFIKRYPSKAAREAADKAVDELSDDVTLIDACSVWSDKYIEIAHNINLKKRQ